MYLFFPAAATVFAAAGFISKVTNIRFFPSALTTWADKIPPGSVAVSLYVPTSETVAAKWPFASVVAVTGAAFLSTRSIRRSAPFAGLLFTPFTSPSIVKGCPNPVLTKTIDEKANATRRKCEVIFCRTSENPFWVKRNNGHSLGHKSDNPGYVIGLRAVARPPRADLLVCIQIL